MARILNIPQKYTRNGNTAIVLNVLVVFLLIFSSHLFKFSPINDPTYLVDLGKNIKLIFYVNV